MVIRRFELPEFLAPQRNRKRRSKLGQHELAIRPSEFVIWAGVQSTIGLHGVAKRSSKLGVRSLFQYKLRQTTLPSGLQSLTFGAWFTASLENATLPSCLQSIKFGQRFNRSLNNTALPHGLAARLHRTADDNGTLSASLDLAGVLQEILGRASPSSCVCDYHDRTLKHLRHIVRRIGELYDSDDDSTACSEHRRSLGRHRGSGFSEGAVAQ